MSVRTRTAALLLFGSGFCALIYQTAWLREFRLIFGASTAASAAVIGIFMAGLGFGGIILGRRSETKAQPLAFYGHLELLIAISAALSPLLIFGARQIYIGLGGTETMGTTLGTIVRLLLAGVIMGLPTFLMGGTLPAVARAIVRGDDVSRRALGTLYGVNTLGAVTGAMAGTFYLFENFGNRLTIWWASGLNLVVALIALRCATTVSQAESETQRELGIKLVSEHRRPIFLFAAAAAVGFAFLLMEMVWYRMLAPLLGGSTFAFGLILSIALLGIGLGGVLYALSEFKRPPSIQLFAVTCAAEALFIALPYALGDRIAVAAMLLRPLGSLGFYGHVLAWTALCSIVVLPAAFVSGFQFPLLISLLGKGRDRVGCQTGAAYAWNTIGALIGSLAGGFGLIPILSAPGVWRLVVILLAGLAIVAACLAAIEVRRILRALFATSIAGIALLLLLATGPTAFWRHSQIGVGHLRQYHASRNDMRELIHRIRSQILWQTDGIESSVALAKSDGLAFIVNGKSDGNAKADAGTQVMCGMVGAILHPEPKDAMVIGLGTGSTAGWLAAVPTMQRVDVVELERSIVKVAEACAPVNRDALNNPKVHLIIGDGRETLLTTRRQYDLIASEPSNPYRAGVAGLFTREFYQSIEKRLKPGGIFLQWMQTYDVDDRTVEIFYRTLGSVFPEIESWQTEEGDLLLVASREPISYDASALRQRLATDPFKSAVRNAWRAEGLEGFLAHYVGNTEMSKRMQNLESWALNTDDRTVIEFALARSLSSTNVFQLATVRAASHAAKCDRPKIADSEIDWQCVREGQLSSYFMLNMAEQSRAGLTEDERKRAAAFLDYTRGDVIGALQLWRAQSAEPQTLTQLALVAEGMAATGDADAAEYIARLAQTVPLDAQAIRAEWLRHQGKMQEAAQTLKDFFDAIQHDAWPDQDLIRRSFSRAEMIATADSSKIYARKFFNQLSRPLAVWNCEGNRLPRLLNLGLYLDGEKPGEYTASALKEFEPQVPWELRFLSIRDACYRNTRSGRAQLAANDLDDFVAHQAFTSDAAALTRFFGSDASAYATEARSKSSPR